MTWSDLPKELECEILSKVPATSLTQLRSTCKRWYVLFKDPIFIKKNIEKAGATQLILKMNRNNVYSVSINLPNKSIEFKGHLKCLKDQQRVLISRIFHCDGLLLCIMRDDEIVVWNPCTGQTRWITPPPSCCGCYQSYDYALGYDNNNSYKILRICTQTLEIKVVQIYEFRSDSWRVLDGVTDHNWTILRRTRQVSLKGKSYWIAWGDNKENPNNKFLLIRFDFERERFESLSLPSECNDDLALNVVLSTVGQEKLSVLLHNFIDGKSFEMKIWVMTDTIKIQYSLVVNSCVIRRQSMQSVDSFLVDEENNKRVVCCGPCEKDGEKEESVVIYFVGYQDRKNYVCKLVHGTSQEVLDAYWPHLFSYVPSLVRIDQNSNKRKKIITLNQKAYLY